MAEWKKTEFGHELTFDSADNSGAFVTDNAIAVGLDEAFEWFREERDLAAAKRLALSQIIETCKAIVTEAEALLES